MKEHLFTLLSKIQAIDGRLPGTDRTVFPGLVKLFFRSKRIFIALWFCT